MNFIQRYDLDNDVEYNASFHTKSLFALVKSALANNVSHEQIKEILKSVFNSIVYDIRIAASKTD